MRITGIEDSTQYVNKAKTNDASSMTQEDFLKILVTQMKNQNPMDPMNDFEYFNQITQFSMLENISALNARMDEQKALAFIGKNVIGTFMAEDQYMTHYLEGLVESVTLQKDKILLNLDTGSIYMDNVIHVF